ncbi:hypothetical protein [Streptomyces sp. NRRL WC-3742]|uniref:hypothetical protein n=1 Tax=Streptomyces sp. NRRL WC-3742 TaxID=1463934 RepID=UPI000692129E|nr:hypothetical protein [Streptomyces sp. NRRL WC-3742]
MTSFLTHRARVHDAGLPLYRRHSALRTCLTEFAPYGLRATYHHLTVSAAMPRRLEADPAALGRAVEELHEARVLWLARAGEYDSQRRAEKRAGRRRPSVTPWWRVPPRESPDAAWRCDPFLHPPLNLPAYVRRQNALLDGAELPGCPACGEEGPAVPVPNAHGGIGLCRACARVLAGCPCGESHPFRATGRAGDGGWEGLWRRQHRAKEGGPNPHWPVEGGAARVGRLTVYGA